MIRRTLFKHALSLVIALGLSGSALAAPAVAASAPAQLEPGKDYLPIRPPQPPESGDKIEVLEFFSFACPHCNDFEPVYEAWVKTLPKDVAVKKIPVSFGREAWTGLAKVYITLDVMGEAERLSLAVFRAVHQERVDFSDEVARNVWLKRNGVDPAKFADTFKSFSVQTQLQHANQLVTAYQIQGVPTLAIDGKYQTSSSIARASFETTISNATQLVNRARAERKPVAATSSKKPSPTKAKK